MWIFIVLGSIIALAVIFGFALGIYANSLVFNKRMDKNPLLKYRDMQEFGINGEAISLNYGNDIIRGFVYGDSAKKSTLIFCHGLGAGCAAYTTEIATLVEGGYRVIALDYRGCGISDGEKVGGMNVGLECVIACVNYAKSRFGGKIVLVGHSWGAYNALCATKFVEVDRVVALAPPESPSHIFTDGICSTLGKWAWIFLPFVSLALTLTNGLKGDLSASRCIDKSGTLALVVQGGKDGVVKVDVAAFYRCRGNNVETLFCEEKRHSPQLSLQSENLLVSMLSCLNGELSDEEKKEKLEKMDFVAMCGQDAEVWSKIFDFINR